MSLTDEQLSALVAEKVAGWTGERFVIDGKAYVSYGNPPPYATSVDAVLPLLEKHTWRGCSHRARGHFYAEVEITTMELKQYRGRSDESLARAACLCLLKAHGVQIEP